MERINDRPVTDEMIEDWGDEAERGHNTERLLKRGRPTIGDGPGEIVPVRMDAALLTALADRAELEHVSRSEAVRAAVRAWLHVA